MQHQAGSGIKSGKVQTESVAKPAIVRAADGKLNIQILQRFLNFILTKASSMHYSFMLRSEWAHIFVYFYDFLSNIQKCCF